MTEPLCHPPPLAQSLATHDVLAAALRRRHHERHAEEWRARYADLVRSTLIERRAAFQDRRALRPRDGPSFVPLKRSLPLPLPKMSSGGASLSQNQNGASLVARSVAANTRLAALVAARWQQSGAELTRGRGGTRELPPDPLLALTAKEAVTVHVSYLPTPRGRAAAVRTQLHKAKCDAVDCAAPPHLPRVYVRPPEALHPTTPRPPQRGPQKPTSRQASSARVPTRPETSPRSSRPIYRGYSRAGLHSADAPADEIAPSAGAVRLAETAFLLLSYNRPFITREALDERGGNFTVACGGPTFRPVPFSALTAALTPDQPLLSHHAGRAEAEAQLRGHLSFAAFLRVLYPGWPLGDLLRAVKRYASHVSWALGLLPSQAEFIEQVWVGAPQPGAAEDGEPLPECLDFVGFAKFLLPSTGVLRRVGVAEDSDVGRAEQVEEIRKIFLATDDDGNGVITKDEFARFLSNAIASGEARTRGAPTAATLAALKAVEDLDDIA
jgi:hypothetical protein